MADFDQLNKDVSGWAKYQSQKMRRQVGALTLKDKHALYKSTRQKATNPDYKQLEKSIGAGIDRKYGQVSRINFRFARHGIFLEHGVGRGRPVRSGAANPKPWIKPILDPALAELADLIEKNYADIAGGELKLNIPGIISRRIEIKNG